MMEPSFVCMMRFAAIAIIISAAAFAPFLLSFGMSAEDGMHTCPFTVGETSTCIGAALGLERTLHHIDGWGGLFRGLVGWTFSLFLLGAVFFATLRKNNHRAPFAHALAALRRVGRTVTFHAPRKSARLLARWRALRTLSKENASAGVYVFGARGVAAAY